MNNFEMEYIRNRIKRMKKRKQIPSANYNKTSKELSDSYDGFKHGYIDDYVPKDKMGKFIEESVKNFLDKMKRNSSRKQ